MFQKILIANRGEIACRIAATARRLGIRTVAVYSDVEHRALHVQSCDEAVHIGEAAPQHSYLRADRMITAAQATGAQAVHPGYGFLSENAAFATACAESGLVFIGPPPAAIEAMGLKAEAKRLMALAGVPLVPGYHGADQDAALLRFEAGRIGYPVLIKASAGGGGKGMRVVTSDADFDAALASCRREALASFGSEAVLIERYLARPRHIEIQVFADRHGHCVHLHERDCSVQRRHQKVLEEAPAPGLGAALRERMGAAAVAAARAVGYVGAGTVEFIAEAGTDGELQFYFMEMNTRLQVEHPVTEAITGLDLVEWQLRVAAGEALPLRQEQVRLDGHAIEARICAEQPDAQFLPSTGVLQVFRTPLAARFERAGRDTNFVRFDAGVGEGDAVLPHYDPMIAKLIVWGADRAQALARLDTALAQTHIVGPHTNVAFLRCVVGSASFAGADLDTGLIERERDALFKQPSLALEITAAGVVAHTLAAERATQDADPWSRRDGWRLHGAARRRFDIDAQGARHVLRLERTHRGSMQLSIGERRWSLAVHSHGPDHHDVSLDGHRWPLAVYATGERISVHAADGAAQVELIDSIAHVDDAGPAIGGLSAPMPGKLIKLMVQPGEVVGRGQALMVMEAMKMEHTIVAPRDGRVDALHHAVGDQVGQGDELLRLVDADADANAVVPALTGTPAAPR